MRCLFKRNRRTHNEFTFIACHGGVGHYRWDYRLGAYVEEKSGRMDNSESE